MNIRTRTLLTVLALSSVVQLRAQDLKPASTDDLSIAVGKFKPDDESFKQYQYPDWFRDAKFGIWSHWGPQAVPRQGDWYARKMYEHDGVNRRTGASSGSFIDPGLQQGRTIWKSRT